ncbi:hypothetical protein IWZ01DRAFT_137414 [Phyllosticta capitalensis]
MSERAWSVSVLASSHLVWFFPTLSSRFGPIFPCPCPLLMLPCLPHPSIHRSATLGIHLCRHPRPEHFLFPLPGPSIRPSLQPRSFPPRPKELLKLFVFLPQYLDLPSLAQDPSIRHYSFFFFFHRHLPRFNPHHSISLYPIFPRFNTCTSSLFSSASWSFILLFLFIFFFLISHSLFLLLA